MVSCDVACHVMSCHLMWWSRHLMRCDCLCCVMSRDAMRCYGHELFSVFLTTKYSSVLQTRTTLYYKVLLQYYSVLLCTTNYYSSTTLYYKLLLQYYSVLQSTSPVLFCTTKYYSSASLYYKVQVQYFSVLQRIIPVLLCTTILLCTTKY